jgi:hypothetical protein
MHELFLLLHFPVMQLCLLAADFGEGEKAARRVCMFSAVAIGQERQ